MYLSHVGDETEYGLVEVAISLPAGNLQLGTDAPEEGTNLNRETMTWSLPSLPVGKTSVLRLEAFVTDVKPGDTITASASIISVDDKELSEPISNSATFTGENAAVNLSPTKTVIASSAQPARSFATRW